MRTLVAASLVVVGSLGACAETPNQSSATTAPEPADPTTTTTTAAPTTTLSVEEQAVADLGVSFPDVVENPAFGTLLALDVTVDDDMWPHEPASLYDDPPGGCEGPVPLDAGPLGPVIRIPYANENFDSVEIFAMPVDFATAGAVESAWDAHARQCTRDVSTGAFQKYHRVELAAGRPVIAAQLVVDRKQISMERPGRPDVAVLDTARWFGVQGDILYVISVAGPEPADALAAASALAVALVAETGP